MAKLVLQPSCHFSSLESLFFWLSSEVLYENLGCVVPKMCPQKQVDVFLSTIFACRGMRKFCIVDYSHPSHAKGYVMNAKMFSVVWTITILTSVAEQMEWLRMNF